MELDDLKRDWARMELRQDTYEMMLRDNFRERRVENSRAAMRWSVLGCVIEIAVWMAFVVIAASFWFDHRHTPHLLIAGLVLHVYGIAAIWAATTQLLLLSRAYLFTAPVLAMQTRLTQLRKFRALSSFLLGLPWLCLWVPCTMIGAQWLFGLDLYAASPEWIYISLAVGAAGIGACLWLARRLTRSSDRPTFVQRLIDDVSGCSLRRASRQLDEIVAFERESQ